MSSEIKDTPWQNGYWYSYKSRHLIRVVDGEKVELKRIICFDYPDIKPNGNDTWTYGEFGLMLKLLKQLRPKIIILKWPINLGSFMEFLTKLGLKFIYGD